MVNCSVFFLFLTLCCIRLINGVIEPNVNEVKSLVKEWSWQLGTELNNLSLVMTRKEKIEESFSPLRDKIYYEDANVLIGSISRELKAIMDKKVKAVRNIAKYAEFLAYHRKTDPIFANDTFDYYNADNITSTDLSKVPELLEELEEKKCIWLCEQENLDPFPLTPKLKESFMQLYDKNCNCSDVLNRNRLRPTDYYRELPLDEHPAYVNTTLVNMNLSIIKVATNIYERDSDVLQGVRWSEPLDVVFKSNWEKDPTLKFQYFASPTGFMRHFPAVQWSDERYAMTYDPRTRSWYTEAMTSPKDIIILLDRSGSVYKRKRTIATHIVNNILDTLNDNDFVNIYTFANTSEPLVPCFKDTLVQANEENLRLLRESLDTYRSRFMADVTIALESAFQLLESFRERETSLKSNCNQAIMLITEAVYYDAKEIFENHNWRKNDSFVRVFTYQLETDEEDARILEFMACSNKGYYANISLMEEVREKVLPYLNVMSRPINMNAHDGQDPIWSYLYIDLADRRYTNWLWRKLEGNRQREVFLDHAKREFMRLHTVLTSENHFLLQESHSYEKYKERQEFDYMTTVSLPVYGRRENDVELIGVAGVDVPIKLLNSLIPHHILGVNAYAFIVTNNGYILMHPGHKREFEDIPKPTFNRVDLLEVEILDDLSEPRLFNKSIVELRKKIVKAKGKVEQDTLNVKFSIDDMKRIILTKRTYIYTGLGPFSLGIALPDNYGLMMVNITDLAYISSKSLLRSLESENWAVHPDWVYCEDNVGKNPKEVIRDCVRNRQKGKARPLLSALLFDFNATTWFDDKINGENYFISRHLVDNVFMSTHSGLTRWKTFETGIKQKNYDDKGERERFWGFKSIDEDWYKRAVEENFDKENMFIYSVPFETSGYEYDNMVTGINAIYVNAGGRKTPLVVVGLQFNYRTMYDFYSNITKKCGVGKKHCKYTCESIHLDCFILDDDAYIVVSDQIEYTGRYIGDIKPEIMSQLVANGVYRATKMFDYQAICQKAPRQKTKSAASSTVTFFRRIVENLLQITDWALATILFLVTSAMGGPDYQSSKNETLAYERLEINKTVPTPCDQQMWLFSLNEDFGSVGYSNESSKTRCSWAYIVQRIPHSNLLFMAVNSNCQWSGTNFYNSPTPVEINYFNDTLACYIATHNNFTRKEYIKCYKNHKSEEKLKGKKYFCGHTWKP